MPNVTRMLVTTKKVISSIGRPADVETQRLIGADGPCAAANGKPIDDPEIYGWWDDG